MNNLHCETFNLLLHGEALPSIPQRIERLYLDFETSSGDKRKTSTYAWKDCFPYGVAFTWDNEEEAYYLPCSHPSWVAYVSELLARSERWVNHNVKYDAHVAAIAGVQIGDKLVLHDTLTMAKLIDSDRVLRGGYGLDALSKGWLGEDISQYEQSLQPYLKKNKDYGSIPHDVLGLYACQDVATNRNLDRYIEERLPAQCGNVKNTEIELTRCLWEMEQYGMRVTPRLKAEQYKVVNRLLQLDEKLERLVGFPFRAHVSDDVFQVLCGTYGLPILAYTKDENGEPTANPSFDKFALRLYLGCPDAPVEIIKGIQEYRKLNQLNNLFLSAWQELMIDGVLHPSYNQSVRTGRMSCSNPNAQQLSKDAKQLIVPREGHTFVSIDYSQIEFRFIVHYIQDERAIKAYNENPLTDFHVMVAKDCGIKRKPAKTVNFGIAFGEGKKKLTQQLATDPDLTDGLKQQVAEAVAKGEIAESQSNQVFYQLAAKKAESVYNGYHDRFPTLKATMRKVENALKQKGYVFNCFGRHRHLPLTYAYRAFNTLNQSSAADLMKERTVEICKHIEGSGIRFVASVHDEILFEVPNTYDIGEVERWLVGVMETPPSTLLTELRVPIKCSVGSSSVSWADAGADADRRNEEAMKAVS